VSRHAIDIEQPADSTRLVELLIDYDGPPERFLVELLHAHCRGAGAQAAALLRLGDAQQITVAGTYPVYDTSQAPPPWIGAAVAALRQNRELARPQVKALPRPDGMYGEHPNEHVLVLPLRRGGQLRGAAAYHLATSDATAIAQAEDQLSWAVGLLGLYELRVTLEQQMSARRALESAQQVLAAMNQQTRFKAAAMALCNELADRYHARRVSIGFLRGRDVHILAMSHTEQFSRKMQVVQDLEAAMAESLDQDMEVLHPVPADAQVVSRATAEFATRHGPGAIVSLPLRQDGEPVAVLTLERADDKPWSMGPVAALRLTGELCAARLAELHDRDRWIGIRAARQMRSGLSLLVGPRHAWAKLAALLLIGAVIFLAVAHGTFRVEAPFIIEATQQRSVPAPFEGQLSAVNAEPGDTVVAGQTVLATLRTEELELERNAAQAEQRRFLREADLAMRRGEQAQRAMAIAQVDQAQARIDLLDHRLAQAKIIAPIDGVIVTSAFHQRSGAPVSKGELLFEIAPLDALRATLLVDEQHVIDLLADDRADGGTPTIRDLSGRLATAADPAGHIAITTQSLHPIAEVVDQRNVFRVKVTIDMTDPAAAHLRPGMEGLAKLDVDRRPYASIWTRDLVRWLRMKLWF